MRTFLLAIGLLSVLSSHVQAQKEAPARTGSTVKRTISVVPDGFIRIFQLTGSVRVQGWDRDSLAVSGTVNVPAQGEFSVTPGKQGARVYLWGPDETRAQPSQLVVYVPRNSRLWIKTQSAQVAVSDFEGRLEVVTVSGAVDVSGKPGEVYVETLGGNTTLALNSRSARIKTGTGQVTVRGTIEDANISTVSGAVSALDATFKQGRFESVEGRISFNGEVTQRAALEFINHSGDIELTLSDESAAALRLSTISGSFKDEWNSGKWMKGKAEGKDLELNLVPDPIADITVRNFKGAVILKKRSN